MKIQIMSDLHLEMHADLGTAFLDALDPSGVDLLILAGDIFSARFLVSASQVFEKVAAKYPQVFYVPGNHEYWRTKPLETHNVLKAAALPFPNVKVMLNEQIRLKGRRFLGGPMFFPRRSPSQEVTGRVAMPDFTLIENFETFAADQFSRFSKLLEENLGEGDVVISHYLPHPNSIPPEFKTSAVNPFFVEDMSKWILPRKPAVWFHGHTHGASDYALGATRVVCNPFGYPRESKRGYVEKKIITLDE